MDKALLSRILTTIKGLGPGEVCPLTVEEAGMLSTFLEVRSGVLDISDGEKALHRRISAVLDSWTKPSTPVANAGDKRGAEQRTQFALRAAIDKVLEERWAELSTDEEQLLRGTRDVYARRAASSSNDRLLKLLTQVVANLDDRAETSGGGEGAAERAPSSFEQRPEAVDHATLLGPELSSADVFAGGQLVPVSLLEGISVDLSVRIFEFEGDVIVKGEIPEDVLAISKHGGFLVNGFVAGNLVAERDVIVKGNVQGGLVISRAGSIELDRALVRSRVIAKNGSVRCEHIEDAECVFAWNLVDVSGCVMGGRVYGARIRVGEKVTSGELHSCGAIDAPRFEVGQRTPPIICLRRRLTCADYSRAIDEKTVGRQKRIRELESQVDLAIATNRFTHQLIHNCFRTGLFYLLGGVESAQSVNDLQGLQMRSVYLRRLIAIAENVSRFHDSLIEEAAPDPLQAGAFKIKTLDELELLRLEVDALPIDFGLSHRDYLLDRCRQFRQLAENLGPDLLDPVKAGLLNSTFARVLDEWQTALADSDRDITRILQRSSLPRNVLEKLSGDTSELEAMLDSEMIRNRSSENLHDQKRGRSPLLRLLKDQAWRYRKTIQQNEAKVAGARTELGQIREVLEGDSAILYGDTLKDDCCVRGGSFTRGIVITTTPGAHEGVDAAQGEVIVLSEDIPRSAIFKLTNRLIQRT